MLFEVGVFAQDDDPMLVKCCTNVQHETNNGSASHILFWRPVTVSQCAYSNTSPILGLTRAPHGQSHSAFTYFTAQV